MLKLFERLKRSVRSGSRSLDRRHRRPRRRDSYHESALDREVAQASPARAGELAGHPTERIDT
jgi:hypothetical protein